MDVWQFPARQRSIQIYRIGREHAERANRAEYARYGTIRPEDIGKTVFLSREEAEKALQKMEGKKDG